MRRSTSMMTDGSGVPDMENLVEGTGKQRRVWDLEKYYSILGSVN